MSPVKYELGFYIPEDDILHSHRLENFRFYKIVSYKGGVVVMVVVVVVVVVVLLGCQIKAHVGAQKTVLPPRQDKRFAHTTVAAGTGVWFGQTGNNTSIPGNGINICRLHSICT
jgi:hypothetical protein